VTGKREFYDEVLPCATSSAKRKATDVVDDGDARLPASSPPSEYAVYASSPVSSASSLYLPFLRSGPVSEAA
jgi:hypothetical protein